MASFILQELLKTPATKHIFSTNSQVYCFYSSWEKYIIITNSSQLLTLPTFHTILSITVCIFFNQHVFSKLVEVSMTQVEGNDTGCRSTYSTRQCSCYQISSGVLFLHSQDPLFVPRIRTTPTGPELNELEFYCQYWLISYSFIK